MGRNSLICRVKWNGSGQREMRPRCHFRRWQGGLRFLKINYMRRLEGFCFILRSTHQLSFSLPLSFSHTLSPSVCLPFSALFSLSISLTRTYTLSLTLSLSHTHTLSLCLSLHHHNNITRLQPIFIFFYLFLCILSGSCSRDSEQYGERISWNKTEKRRGDSTPLTCAGRSSQCYDGERWIVVAGTVKYSTCYFIFIHFLFAFMSVLMFALVFLSVWRHVPISNSLYLHWYATNIRFVAHNIQYTSIWGILWTPSYLSFHYFLSITVRNIIHGTVFFFFSFSFSQAHCL